MPKKKLKDIHTVEPNGRPTEVKVGYKTIKIEYIRPDFINDDMTDAYGSSSSSSSGCDPMRYMSCGTYTRL